MDSQLLLFVIYNIVVVIAEFPLVSAFPTRDSGGIRSGWEQDAILLVFDVEGMMLTH